MSETLQYTVPDVHGADASITLDVIALEEFTEEAVTDERGNYCLNQITARWRTIFNPGANSYRMNGLNLQKQSGHMPAVTEQSLIWFLQQARGQLVWTIGDNVQLRSPLSGKSVDSHNGPIPKIVSIQKINGVRCYEIVWEVTTWLNQSFKVTNTPPVLLSNTWTMQEVLNEQYLSVRQIEGRAKFDPSRMQPGTVPDDYRDWVLPVACRGFKRTVNVMAAADGSQLLYSVQDVEQRVKLEIPGVTDVTAQVSLDFIMPSVASMLGTAVEAVAGAVSAASSMAKNIYKKARNDTQALGMAAGGGLMTTLNFNRNLSTNIPINVHTVQVRVWGAKSASISYLTIKALQIAEYHLREAELNTGGPHARWGHNIIQDIDAGIVQVNRMVMVPPAGLGGPNGGAIGQLNNFAATNKQGFLAEADYTNQANVPAPIPAAAVNSSVPPKRKTAGVHGRGEFIGRIFAQALQSPGEAPVQPALPISAVAVVNPNS